MHKMWITFATKEDIPYIVNMEKECFNERAWTKDMIMHDFENRTMFIVCKEEDEYLGYMCILDIDEECEILRIGVRKKFRKRGYGQSMIEFLLEYCLDNKKNKVFLEVSSLNRVAIDLYKRLGFEQISTRKNYYAQGEDAKIFIKFVV